MTGSELKQARERLGMTQAQLHRAIYLWAGMESKPYGAHHVSKWERGVHSPPAWIGRALEDLQHGGWGNA
jgi:transcriptional regulator with XRE-family HTH domain